MDTCPSTISIPVIPYYCNVVVFPLPPGVDYDDSPVFVLKKSALLPAASDHDFTLEYLPSHVYCLLPSIQMQHWTVSLYKSRPAFLKNFSFCLQIDPRTVFISKNCTVIEELALPAGLEGSISTCKGCFVSHFPRPNQKLCKWDQSKKKESKASKFKTLPHLKGGAMDPAQP